MIDFSKIRGEAVEAQRSYFEQLVCHLARLDKSAGGEFRRIESSGGDGGVEALRILPTNRKIGYQAKFYPSAKSINWKILDDSVKTALAQHAELERYIIALPCDFTGTRAARNGSTDGIWGKWDTKVTEWKSWANASHMKVEFEPWTAFELEGSLLRSDAQHLIHFFFDRLIFTPEWFEKQLNRTLVDLQARYSPHEHVDTEALKPFDVIHRREPVRNHLKSIFELARQSNPRVSASLVKSVAVPDTMIIEAETAQSYFLAFEEAVDWKIPKPWPVCRWITSWYAFTRKLQKIDQFLWTNKDPDDSPGMIQQVEETLKISKLIGPEVFGGAWMYMLPIDGARAALFIGEAGAGKSHVLARGSEIACSEGIPVVHLLGQYFSDKDPRISILERLELTKWTFHELLTALNLAAEAKNTRALLVIDALNEGRGIEIWRKHLETLIREVNEYERVVLVVSCRLEYLDYVVPSELIATPHPYPDEKTDQPHDCAPLGKLVRVKVRGFRTAEEREAALQKFMDEKGIARPTAPVLDPEFFNPLFMSSVCRSMAKAGLTIFPDGLHGARDIFAFVLQTKAKALGTRYDGTERVYLAMLAALDELARRMVERKDDKVPLNDALEILAATFASLPISDQTWLEVLEGSDILRRDVDPTEEYISEWSKPREVIRFSFQRLQDNLIAQHLISESRSLDIEQVFEPGGPWAFLLRRSTENGLSILNFNSSWIGVIGALWAAVAETYGKELYDLRSFFGNPDVHFYPVQFRPVFRTSIRERKGTAFTDRTKEILNLLWEDSQRDKLGILLSTSSVPAHSWNADYLTERLLSLSTTERISAWSDWFDTASDLRDRARTVTNWALKVNVKAANAEVVRLTALTLACLLMVKNPEVHQPASKALENLLAGAPNLGPMIRQRFGDTVGL